MSEHMISVGIDIGTTTTQIIFSKLTFENQGSCFSVPDVSIVNKEILYLGNIYMTPLLSEDMINVEAVKEIVEKEYWHAGIAKAAVETGAVIITGESASKENSRLVLNKLSDFAGDFVVATAGPDLESDIAGKGAGALEYSKKHKCRVINVDIGGGTTNIALFSDGVVIGRTCINIGGHQICVEKGRVSYVSKRLDHLQKKGHGYIEKGDKVSERDIITLAKRMSDVILEAIGEKEKKELNEHCITYGSSILELDHKADYVFFSGGVAECIKPSGSSFAYGDIGDILGTELFNHENFPRDRWVKTKEAIRATVIGAGMHTTQISGSTITCTRKEFPIKNVPVFKVEEMEIQDLINGKYKNLMGKIMDFCIQRDAEKFIISFCGEKSVKYIKLVKLAKGLAEVYKMLAYKGPVLVIVYHDCAKALGQLIDSEFNYQKEIICIDGIAAMLDNFVDYGKPIMDGMVIPVVVKTLIFNT